MSDFYCYANRLGDQKFTVSFKFLPMTEDAALSHNVVTAKRICILFVIDSLGPGGAERQLVELIKGLFEADLYEIHLICLMRVDEGYTSIVNSLGIEVHYFPRALKYDLLYPLYEIIRYIKKNRIELVHTFLNMGSLFGVLAAKLTGLPVICSIVRNAKDFSWRDRFIKRFLVRLADIYVSNSQAGFDNRFKEMSSHFRVVYNGIDLNRFETENNNKVALKKELGFIGFSPIVGMVASFTKNKDQETLINTVPEVLRGFPKALFIFVGDGETRTKLVHMVDKMGLNQQVVFTGFRADVDRIYSIIDVCVLLTNSKQHLEGIPNVLVEAMACGVPVIASDGGGTNEIVEHMKTGVIVSPYDPEGTARAIIRLLSDFNEANRLARRAKENVQNLFNLKKFVHNYEAIYRQVLMPER